MGKIVTGSSRREKQQIQKKVSTGADYSKHFYSPNARIDWKKFGRGPTAADLKEIPEATGPFFRIGSILNWGNKGPKAQITIRLDQDVLKWLRSKGPGYQTMLNLLLREHMFMEKSRKPQKSRKKAS